MRKTAWILWAGWVVAGAATGQPVPPPGQPTSQPVPTAGQSVSLPGVPPMFDASERILQPGDQLEINILTIPELEKRYSIRADGTFFHPFAGEVKASGKTLKQLEALLRQRFRKELRKPAFRLGLTQIVEGDAAVLGEVKTQGKFKFLPGMSVMELLAQAGGLNERADQDGAVILRAGKPIPLDLSPKGQAQLSALKVQNGDIIYVNRGRRVGVSGEVLAKGVYVVSSKSLNPVEDLIKAAGGASETAALNRVQIIRPSLSRPLEVDLLNPKAAQVALEDGDTVLLPPRRAIVLGAVGKPGPLPLTGNETLVDIMALVGMGAATGKIDSVIVIRSADVMAGNDKKEVYNLESALGEGNPLGSVPIHDGDLVFVPTKDQSPGLLGGTGLMGILMLARSFTAF